MRNDSFAALILTHGRPDNVKTYDTLRSQGYTGRIVLVLDNEDKTADEYRQRFSGKPGVEIVVFDKAAIAETFDTADNSSDRRTIVYARNASYQIARDLGVRFFIQLDDDYLKFSWRFDSDFCFYFPQFIEHGDYKLRNMDAVFDLFVDFIRDTPAKTIAMAQGGDFIGGQNGRFGKLITLYRKAMNTFVCDVEKPITFLGRINEDVSTYTRQAVTGDLFFTYNFLQINQPQTATAKGGITEVYQGAGQHVKPSYTVMYHPSGVRLSVLPAYTPRIHHHITWNKTYPMILSEKHRKPR